MQIALVVVLFLVLASIITGYIYYGMQMAIQVDEPIEPLVEAEPMSATEEILAALNAAPTTPVNQEDAEAIVSALEADQTTPSAETEAILRALEN